MTSRPATATRYRFGYLVSFISFFWGAGLPAILVANKRAYRQLKDEALVAMRLVHPNIVQIRAFEENNGNPFLVMDYVDGETLDDYLAQMAQLRKMGNLEQLVGMIPGMNRGALKDAKIDEKDLARTEAIVRSMTMKERTYPEIINGSRKKRIAAGSGTSVEDVNKLLKQFDQMLKMMKQFSGGKQAKRMLGRMKMPF